MIISAMDCNDFYYINRNHKRVCFKYKFEKRVKTKITNFLKNNHEESKIIKFLDELGLQLINVGNSRRYIHYEIIEKGVNENERKY